MTKTKTKKKAKTEARADKRSGILDQARRAALMEELGAQLYAPPLAAKVFETEEKVRERFALPVTLGTTEEVRLAQDCTRRFTSPCSSTAMSSDSIRRRRSSATAPYSRSLKMA